METTNTFNQDQQRNGAHAVHTAESDSRPESPRSVSLGNESSPSSEKRENETESPYFTPMEARVIACLMEKQLTTPNNYPLTLNSLTNACNQKSNREPLMKLSEGQVGHTVNQLVERKLAGLDYGERSNKISHRVVNTLELNRKQQAVLTVLMLRKPQTLNDIRVRTSRMVEFSDVSEVLDTLEQLINREKPLAVLIPKGAGRREERYAHTLCGDIPHEQLDSKKAHGAPLSSDLDTGMDRERLAALETRVTAIEKKLGMTVE